MNRLDDMRLFAAVVDLDTFSAAADHLELSRAMLSRRVTALEQYLGVRLLNRTTRRLDLTEAGGIYYGYCRQVLETAREAEESLRAVRSEPAGLLRVAMPILLGEDVFAPLLAEFRKRYPGIHLRMGLTDQPADLVASGYDLVIRWGASLEDSSYMSRLIARMPVITCGSPEYLARMGWPDHPRDVKQHNCLIYSPLREGHEIWRFDVEGEELEIAVEGDIEANHGKPLVTAAVAGLGLLYAPRFFVDQYLGDGRLVRVLQQFPYTANIHALYPHRMITMKERVFLDFLSEQVPAAVGDPQAG